MKGLGVGVGKTAAYAKKPRKAAQQRQFDYINDGKI